MGIKHRSSSCDAAARRAWRLLRLALLWARKGGLLKCRLMAEIWHVPKYLKGLNHNKHSRDMIRYGERELSFDETPVIHLKMSRPASLRFMIPCMKPDVVDFDYDFGDHDDLDDIGWGCYNKAQDHDHDDDQKEIVKDNEECEEKKIVSSMGYEDEMIDDKAEEFIAKFYKQMKLQREISFQRRHNNHNNAIEVL